MNSLHSKKSLGWTKYENRIRISEHEIVHLLDEMRRKKTYDEIISELRDLKVLLARAGAYITHGKSYQCI